MSSHGWFVEALNGVDSYYHPWGDCTWGDCNRIHKKEKENIVLNVSRALGKGLSCKSTLRDSHKRACFAGFKLWNLDISTDSWNGNNIAGCIILMQ